MAEQQKDPYRVLLKTNKIPMSLIEDNKDALPEDGIRRHKAKMTIETEPFSETFGPKSQRKRVKLSVPDIASLAGETVSSFERFQDRQAEIRLLSGQAGFGSEHAEGVAVGDDGSLALAKEPVFRKGTRYVPRRPLALSISCGLLKLTGSYSKRIWNELYKVIDSSDVIFMVLDARDPLGTRCRGYVVPRIVLTANFADNFLVLRSTFERRLATSTWWYVDDSLQHLVP
jgi:nuclear GTP-binding protein